MHRIATNAELADLHAAGVGYIFNDFTSGSAGARDNVLHETGCDWVRRMLAQAEPQNRPSVRKIFFATLSEALPWLESNRGTESRAWKRCTTCRPSQADTGKHAIRSGQYAFWVLIPMLWAHSRQRIGKRSRSDPA